MVLHVLLPAERCVVLGLYLAHRGYLLELNGRSGFTLVEIIVAIVILTVGILGIVGATAKMTALQSRGERLATAAFYAQSRMEQLRAAGCNLAAGGNETLVGVYIMTWTVAAQASGSRAVMVAAEYPTGTAAAAIDTFETYIPCP
ncbi:MAG: prepilin-type N-terminal cleavage/methylation domain-containing protein [Gemmatimonadetes bacterium]|nr:prepilin-type N-terminal cleavage/methylation domain-containing protein [Gemmatimonadota bacterium]